ncbi:type II 3-dehydroquinate dehydratase [Microbacterium protaetiae]|uniref:3-dehydroquinate dehydratase n=2 Tax=Microbacterium protaetiae TaxID=2509458 RepID=A0A4P6EHA7_9MICO|nr:type II 3-dehydroquinate dehydratase [Microbacterium protaetiae]QAY61705.1 type II 3-dehydroquinate dehydratase [Microbacterium protaetiae]
MIINGPNINLLGLREPHLYGTDNIEDVKRLCDSVAEELGLQIEFHQSNHEGEIVDLIQRARTEADGIVINPAGYTSTSIAILDTLLAAELPVVEVHVTNIHRREQFRQHSYVSHAASAVVMGAGIQGYEFALRRLATLTAA